MKIHEATEQAYKNGYEDGYRDGKNRAMEEIAFPKFLVRPHEPSKKELEDLLYSSPAIIATNEEIIPIYPYRWIPVTERLPEKNGIYQIFGYDKDWEKDKVWYGQFSGRDWFIYDICGDGKLFEVTHWQYLPQPPKGE